MAASPFRADGAVPERLASYPVAEVVGAAMALFRGGILPAAAAAGLVQRFAMPDLADLMLLLLGPARARARPPISAFQVGAVGLEAGSGDLILGHNIEFPGTHLGMTLHAEGVLAIRAFHRGQRLAMVALGEAHPCGHCRQFLSEFAGSELAGSDLAGRQEMVLIDPLGHRLRLAELYPWPFDPGYLGQAGAVAGRVNWPDLTPEAAMEPGLLAAGQRAYSPYSRCPAAVGLQMADGRNLYGLAIESVAFNPTISPMQAAMAELLGQGLDAADIRGATLAQVRGGAVDHGPGAAELLARVAPGVALRLQGWRA